MENGSAEVPSIEFTNMSRVFGDTRAVDQLSFKVFPGEVFGFIGPNGAGKTTSMRILATLDMPSAGDALVDGLSVIDDPDRVRRRLGFMPDQFGVYPNVTCEEYLDFFARSYGLKGSDRRQCLNEVMAFTQLDRIAQKPMNGLSKGMRQRLCLSRTLIHNPSVLILDEPAAGLDPRARIELRDMIVALGEMGKTSVAIFCPNWRRSVIALGLLNKVNFWPSAPLTKFYKVKSVSAPMRKINRSQGPPF